MSTVITAGQPGPPLTGSHLQNHEFTELIRRTIPASLPTKSKKDATVLSKKPEEEEQDPGNVNMANLNHSALDLLHNTILYSTFSPYGTDMTTLGVAFQKAPILLLRFVLQHPDFRCAILYYTILYYTILYYTILYYTILYYTILCYTIQYNTIQYNTIQYNTIQIQYNTIRSETGR
eukprot:g74143.t1